MKKLAIFLINFYRNQLSPLKMSSCRFYPSCSAYAKEAVEKKGALRGLLMAAWRIMRCNPFSVGGFDPPEQGSQE